MSIVRFLMWVRELENLPDFCGRLNILVLILSVATIHFAFLARGQQHSCGGEYGE